MKAGLSIRAKMLAVTVLLLGALVAVAALVLVHVIGPSFATLERQKARDTVQIIRNTVKRDIVALNLLTQDWAYWDDTYEFVMARQDAFVAANLIQETFVGAALNLLLIKDLQGRVIWGKRFDLEARAFLDLGEFAQGSDLLTRLTDRALASDKGIRGLVASSAGPMMIAAHPILTSAETGPSRGILIMGRLLGDAVLADIGDALGLTIAARPAEAPKSQETPDAATSSCAGKICIKAVGPDTLHASITLKDVFGQPLVVLSTSIRRTVTAVGRTAQATGLAITGLAGLILIAVFLLSQQRLVLGPLRQLTSRVERIGRQGENDTPLPETRRDEFGILAQSFNRMQTRVARLTNFDAVTGLPNRRLFHDRANQVLRIARRGGKAAVLFIDLDDFKAINDTRGHSVGDALLRVIGEELSDLMRETDTVARFGGDEFVIAIHPVDTERHIDDLSRRLQARFQKPFRVDGAMLFTNASIGVAVFPDDADDVETLISLADAAMYQAKGDGGRKIAYIDTEAYQADGQWRNLELSFREAMNSEQLYLIFQPQVDLDSATVIGHEALVRWQHPGQGKLMASHFIHLAERAGNFARFDAWALRAACQALARGEPHGGARLEHVSVNICARHVQSPALVDLVKDTLAETGVAPSCLTLEITETVMVTRPEKAIDVLSSLREIGVRIAIDDFGTGYASLAALHRFPVDALKIDRGFIAGLPDDRAALAITQATLTLARTLGLDVIAEGVETVQQRDTLIKAGCRTGQGFLWEGGPR